MTADPTENLRGHFRCIMQWLVNVNIIDNERVKKIMENIWGGKEGSQVIVNIDISLFTYMNLGIRYRRG